MKKTTTGMDLGQFKRLISITLMDIGLHSKDAVMLLLRTAAQETLMGHYIKQVGKGPALGVFQMEPATFDYNLRWLTTRKAYLMANILESCAIDPSINLYPELMMFNLKFAISMARVHYLTKPGKLPSDINGQWEYYKKHYNSCKGAATKEEFFRNCERYDL